MRNICGVSFLRPDLLVTDIQTLLLEVGGAASLAAASSQADDDRRTTLAQRGRARGPGRVPASLTGANLDILIANAFAAPIVESRPR